MPELIEDDLIHCKYSEKKGLPGTFRKGSGICRDCDRLLCDLRIAPKGEATSPRVRKANAKEFCERFRIRELYHITSWRNVGSIIKHGLLSPKLVELKDIAYDSIADQEIREMRGRKIVDSRVTLYVDDFVPLFFAMRTPMLYKIMCTERQQSEIVYICIDPMILGETGVRFSDGNVARHETRMFYKLEDLEKLDWDTIRSSSWNRFDFAKKNEARRVKSAEVLVPYKVDRHRIHRIVTHNKDIGNALKLAFPRLQIPIEVNPDFYF